MPVSTVNGEIHLAKGEATQANFSFNTASGWKGPVAVTALPTNVSPGGVGKITLVTQFTASVFNQQVTAGAYAVGIQNVSDSNITIVVLVMYDASFGISAGMTDYRPEDLSGRLLVVTDQTGEIVAAARSASTGDSPADAPDLVGLVPADGQVLHDISVPDPVELNDIFNSLPDLHVTTGDGTPKLARKSGS